jgi:uroporphyrinogen decarboxylase
MNQRDLFLQAIDGKAARVPFDPFIMHLAARLYNVNYSQVYCQNGEILAECQVKCSDFFGLNHVNVASDAYREASAWGVKVNFNTHTPVAEKELNIEEFDSIETPDLLNSIRVQDRVKAVKKGAELIKGKKAIIGWIEAPFAEICCLFGVMNVLKLGRNPDWSNQIKKLMDRILPVQLEFAKMQYEAGADLIGAGDSIVSQIGPKRYESACYEKTKQLFASIKKFSKMLYHCCGDNSGVDAEKRDMLKLIGTTGASILDIDYQVDLTMAKQKIGNQVCLRGNT